MISPTETTSVNGETVKYTTTVRESRNISYRQEDPQVVEN